MSRKVANGGILVRRWLELAIRNGTTEGFGLVMDAVDRVGEDRGREGGGE